VTELAVSVIVPARNAAGTIGRTLEALARQDLPEEYEVIVVDDGSSDDTAAIAKAASGPVSVLSQGAHGPGQARNLGARAARGAVLAFTDADCFPERSWLRAGLAALRNADLVQGAARPEPGVPLRPFDHTIWIERESGLYETANLFVRRDLFMRVGGFEDWLDVRIGKGLGEDVWFGWQARRAGARTAFCEEALVHHAVFARRWYEFVAERRRLVYFPALVRRAPELRSQFLWARAFVTRRAAAFDAALAGTAGAIACLAVLPPGTALVPLIATLPYSRILARRVLGLGRHGPKVALVEATADLVGFAALAWGSLRRRTLVL
jgi:glycosyltransferase involved in cell wall biosynthesis